MILKVSSDHYTSISSFDNVFLDLETILSLIKKLSMFIKTFKQAHIFFFLTNVCLISEWKKTKRYQSILPKLLRNSLFFWPNDIFFRNFFLEPKSLINATERKKIGYCTSFVLECLINSESRNVISYLDIFSFVRTVNDI